MRLNLAGEFVRERFRKTDIMRNETRAGKSTTGAEGVILWLG